MQRLVASIVGNNVLANVVLILIIALGVMSAVTLTRESMPEFDLNLIEIGVPYPGADPEEVEEGISRRIEAVVDGLEGIKKYSTASYEGYSDTTIEVTEG
jgi:multidrug efflux pump subunit AcrB